MEIKVNGQIRSFHMGDGLKFHQSDSAGQTVYVLLFLIAS